TRICDRANSSTHETFVGIASLAGDCGVSRPTVIAAVAKLIESDFLRVRRASSGRRSRTLWINRARLEQACGQEALPQTGEIEAPSGQEALPQTTPGQSGAVKNEDRCGQVFNRSGQEFGCSGKAALSESSIFSESLEPRPTAARAAARSVEFSKKEMERAALHRRVTFGGCPHQPKCATYTNCLVLVATTLFGFVDEPRTAAGRRR
ncbi:MAG: helix-turn-helix domain-containing protein, partial [Acidobacteriota bacterium]|nr:helix-turn-helix domain-containing protein [Acidobacteriota bacterium]